MSDAACTRPVSDEARERLRVAVALLGEHAVIERSGLSRQTLARVLAALPVRRVTALAIEEGLRRLEGCAA